MKAKKPDSKKKKRVSTKLKETKKYKLQKAVMICSEYEAGNVTISACCSRHGISAKTWWNWCESITEITDLYKKAKEVHNRIGKESIGEKAVKGLSQLLTGFMITETTTEETRKMINDQLTVVHSVTKTWKKFIRPSAAAVIFALKNTDPSNWNVIPPEEFDPDDDKQEVFEIGGNVIKFN